MKKLEELLTLRCVSLLIVAELLGISKGLCYRMAKEGVIPTVRIGRRLVVPVEAMHKFLADGKGVRACPDASGKQRTETAQYIDAETVGGVPPSG